MADHDTRVALLARPGPARECLQEALREAGAELVAVADPVADTVDEVAGAAPQAVLVALEPAIEDALEGWTPLLSDPGIAVIYDEAELAAVRTGWDAARWIRHLRAKLARNDNVLPPGAEPEQEWQLVPGPLPSPSLDVSEEDFRSIEDEAQQSAAAVPADEGLEAWLAKMAVPGADASGSGPDAAAGEISTAEADAAAAGIPATDPVAPADGDMVSDAAADRLQALEARISGLSLADIDSYGHGPERGAVVVEAGLGGPDAVRQLLAALEAGFPRPLLVRLRLDGGRYDRLVRQMDRATPLSVALAEEGGLIQPGHVYFLPPELGVAREKGELRFVPDAVAMQGLPGGLPDHDSAILFLSGADPGLVDEAMARAASGTLVLGQSPEDNFDPAASSRLLERGGSAAVPAGIAAQLLERWPPPAGPAGSDLEEPEP